MMIKLVSQWSVGQLQSNKTIKMLGGTCPLTITSFLVCIECAAPV